MSASTGRDRSQGEGQGPQQGRSGAKDLPLSAQWEERPENSPSTAAMASGATGWFS